MRLAGLTAVLVVLTAPAAAAAPQPLIVAPGQVGALRMGTSTVVAEQSGWIAVDTVCQGWTAGPLAYKFNRHGEVFKAYPDRIKKQRVASMWATGHVATARGIHTDGLGSRAQRGSTVMSLREAYPGLVRQGQWFNSTTGDYMRVYSIGNPKQGYLDFFVSGQRVSFVVARTKSVAWDVGPAGGC